MHPLDACVAVLFAAAVAALAVAAATDLSCRIVPNGCAAALAVTGAGRAVLAAVRTASAAPLASSLAGGAAVLLVMLAAAAVSECVSGKVGVGGGDVKLLSAVGLWLGPWGGLAAVAGSCLVALAGLILVSIIRYLSRHKNVISHGVATVRGIPLAPGIALVFIVFSLLGGHFR